MMIIDVWDDIGSGNEMEKNDSSDCRSRITDKLKEDWS